MSSYAPTFSPRTKAVSIGLVVLATFIIIIISDGRWAQTVRSSLVNVILYPLALVFPSALRPYLLSSGIVGVGFNGFVYLGVNFPFLWQLTSSSLLSSTAEAVDWIECPPGHVVRANPSHAPSSNGCGADDVKIDKQYLPYEEQVACCNLHDICYDTCHTDGDPDARAKCDLEFKNCLNTTCVFKGWMWDVICPFKWFLPSWFWEENCEASLRNEREKKCTASVEVLYKFVDGLGSAAYRNAQQTACICVPENESTGSSAVGLFIAGLLLVFLVSVIFYVIGRGRN